jgi:hypothetical protein
MVNRASQTCPVLDSSFFVPVPTLKCQNPLLSYVRERGKVHCNCSMQCTVHFIITLFHVLLCVIYQLNFTVFMYVTRLSRYIERSVLSAVSQHRGRFMERVTRRYGSTIVLCSRNKKITSFLNSTRIFEHKNGVCFSV